MWILEVKSSSPPPFPSLLYLSTFHRFSTFPFPLFPFPSYPTLGTFLLSSSYLTILLPFPVPSVVPYIPLSLSTFLLPQFPIFLFPSQPSFFRLNLPSLSSTVTLPLFLSFSTSLFFPFFPIFIPLFFSLSQGGRKEFYTPLWDK